MPVVSVQEQGWDGLGSFLCPEGGSFMLGYIVSVCIEPISEGAAVCLFISNYFLLGEFSVRRLEGSPGHCIRKRL